MNRFAILLAVASSLCLAASTSLGDKAPSGPAVSSTVNSQIEGNGGSDTIALLQRIHEQDRRIAQLEAKVGVPSTMLGWTWFLVGLVGEGVFFLRFVVQWWASERQKRTVVPMAFWHLSLAGTALVLAYAVFVINPVFILAYSLNIFLYVRNLIIARKHPEQEVVMEKESE